MRRAIILLALLLAACSSSLPSLKPYRMDVQQGNVINAKMMSQLRPGMTKSQVRFILGTPLIQDSFHKDRWDYFYQMRKAGTVVEQRRVILDFQNDLLKGVRGDVIAADATPEGEAAKVAAAPAAAASKTEEKKGLTDKLKFWKKDEPASQPVPAEGSQRAEVAVPADLLPATAAASTAAVVAEQSKPAMAPPAPAEDAPSPAAESQPQSETLIAPAAATASASAGAEDAETQAVTATLNAWAEAWSRKDAAAYLAFYSDTFVPDASPGKRAPSRKTWIAQRKQRLAQPGAVSVALEDIKINATANKATARFVQNYVAGGRIEHADKLLQLENSGGKWLITREVSQVALNRSADVQVKPMAQQAVPAVEAASQVEPAAAPAASAADASAAVTSRVQAWARAWRDKDVDAYLAFYAENFVPDSAPSKKAWVAQRKQRLAKPGAISLELKDVQVKAEGDKATANFVQRYSANGYSDNVSKTLQLQLHKVSGNWLIVKETAGAPVKPVPAGKLSEDNAPTPQLTPEQKSEYMTEPAPQPAAPAAATPATPANAATPSTAAPKDTPPTPAPVPAPSAEPVQAAPAAVAKPSTTGASSQEKLKEAEKATPPDEQEAADAPGLFERMLEKIGF